MQLPRFQPPPGQAAAAEASHLPKWVATLNGAAGAGDTASGVAAQPPGTLSRRTGGGGRFHAALFLGL